jgi:hypothetical protein
MQATIFLESCLYSLQPHMQCVNVGAYCAYDQKCKGKLESSSLEKECHSTLDYTSTCKRPVIKKVRKSGILFILNVTRHFINDTACCYRVYLLKDKVGN